MHISKQAFSMLVPLGAGAYEALSEAAESFDIQLPDDEAIWLGEMAVESNLFKTRKENLNYSVEGLLSTFGAHRITPAQASLYGRKGIQPANQQAIANIVYGGDFGIRELGNTMPGDGWRFIGRGYKQLTGRSNYARCSRGIHGDDRFLEDPTLLEKIDDAALSAGWFWKDKALSAVAKRGGIKAVTMKITGWDGEGDGSNVSFVRRQDWYKRFKEATT